MASNNSLSDLIYPITDYAIAGILEILDIKNEYEAKEKSAIEEFVKAILFGSPYPDSFPRLC